MRRPYVTAFALIVSLCLIACGGGGAKGPNSAADYSFSPSEARAYLAELRAQRSPSSSLPADPKSMDEVFEILLKDDVARFEGASRFTEGMQGAEALSLRASIELMGADVYSTVAELLYEMSRREQMEVDRLTTRQKGGIELTASESKNLHETQKRVAQSAKTEAALRILADEQRAAGGSLAQESIKQYPKHPSGYRAAAYFYLLEANWLRYDDVMNALEGAEEDQASLDYFRAMESLLRELSKEGARAALHTALEKNPQLVRAQAKLVLVQDDIDGRYAELQKLKEMNPEHPVVHIAGPGIEGEYQISEAVRGARSSAETTGKETDASNGSLAP